MNDPGDAQLIDRYLNEAGMLADDAAEALAQRDATIHAAVCAGASLRAVARATGMTHRGISLICRRLEATDE